MKNIHIPEPCSENWNEMTPTQKGAFCQKCALDVHDFTNKSGNEIRDILALNIGSRVCGRIENTQLMELNSNFEAWKMNNERSYQRAWIFTLFIVFGLTLFSCEEDDGSVIEKMQLVGQQIILDQEARFEGDTIVAGQVMVDEVNVDNAIELPVPVKQIEPVVLGEIAYIPEELEEVVVVEENQRTIQTHSTLVAGGLSWSTSYETYLNETKTVESTECTKMSGLMYPNPATNESTLKLQMPQKGKAEIYLYGLNGERIREIHSGRVSKGETEFSIDLSDLDAGMYLVVIVSDNQKETVKFTKI